MKKIEVLARIGEIGIIPSIRVPTAEDALFAARAVLSGEISIVEMTMTVPGAIDVIETLAKESPDMVIGAGTIWDLETARRCVDAGASFLTCTGLDLSLVDFAVKNQVAVLPGALTPTEVMTAWRAGADLVKVFPCSQMGGASYIRVLRGPLPQVPLVASGGVSQQTAGDFILAGAAALGIGADLVPHEAIRQRHPEWIQELTRRFVNMVKNARRKLAGSVPRHAADGN